MREGDTRASERERKRAREGERKTSGKERYERERGMRDKYFLFSTKKSTKSH